MSETTQRFLKKASEITGETLSNTIWGIATGGVAGGAIQAARTVSKEAAKLIFREAMISVVTDVASRQLSERQQCRAAACAVHAMNRIFERLINKDRPREDQFFRRRQHDEQRSDAEILFEGVMLKSQDEYEEKKVPFLGNIFANSAFTDLSPATLNDVLRVAERLSYRQLCILSCLGGTQIEGSFYLQSEDALRAAVKTRPDADFIHRSLLEMSDGMGLLGYDHGPTQVVHGRSSFEETAPGKLSASGQTCFDLMELDGVPLDDLKQFCGTFL